MSWQHGIILDGQKLLPPSETVASRTHWSHGVSETNGINVHYLRTGGDKPPLIALHGLIANGACWTPVTRALEADYDVVMPDARGHGKSSAPLHGYLYNDLATDVIGLIGALGLDNPIVFGHSMGGMTAAVVASLLGTAIRGVILADPTFLSPQWQRETYESDLVEQHRQFLKSGRGEVLNDLQRRQPHRSPELLEVMADARMATNLSAFEVLTPPNPDYRELISKVRVPTLLVIGDRGVVSVETARELQYLNKSLRYELIPDAGHGLPYDQPDCLARVARSFLRSLHE